MSRPVYYHGSEGTENVEDIHLGKLKNVISKIERMGSSNENFDNLGAIKAIYDRRKAEWDAEHPQS